LQEPGSAGMDIRSTLECIDFDPESWPENLQYVCAGGLDILNFDKRYTNLCVSYYNFGGLKLCLGDKPTKAPVATGLLRPQNLLMELTL